MAYIGKSPSGTGVRIRYYFTQTSGGATSISGTDDNNKTLSFSDGEYVDVYLNGVSLVAGTDYNTTTANTIGGLSALANGDVIEVVVYDIFTVADTVSQSSGGTFSGAVIMSNGLTVDDDGATVLTVDRATSDGTIIDVQRGGSSLGAIGSTSSKMTVGGTVSGDSHLRFGQTGGVPTIQPANNSAALSDNTVSLGQSGYRFKDLYLGGGAYIGGTGAANYLDDVEEGTFTATLNGGSGHPTSRVTTTGYYTKVNTMVFISINFENISTTSYSGSISVFGLPFACGNGAARQVFTIAFYELASFSGTGGAFGHLSATGTEIYLLNNRSTNSWENLTHAAGSANRYLVITGTYSAA